MLLINFSISSLFWMFFCWAIIEMIFDILFKSINSVSLDIKVNRNNKEEIVYECVNIYSLKLRKKKKLSLLSKINKSLKDNNDLQVIEKLVLQEINNVKILRVNLKADGQKTLLEMQ